MNKFNIGDVIYVKAGIKDPDFGETIEGWVGTIKKVRITDNLDVLYEVRWNTKTQDKMSGQLKKACSDLCLDHEHMYLMESDIELSSTDMSSVFPNGHDEIKDMPHKIISEYLSRGWL